MGILNVKLNSCTWYRLSLALASVLSRRRGALGGGKIGPAWYVPNMRVEPTALLWRFARGEPLATEVISRCTLPEPGGGSRAGR